MGRTRAPVSAIVGGARLIDRSAINRDDYVGGRNLRRTCNGAIPLRENRSLSPAEKNYSEAAFRFVPTSVYGRAFVIVHAREKEYNKVSPFD